MIVVRRWDRGRGLKSEGTTGTRRCVGQVAVSVALQRVRMQCNSDSSFWQPLARGRRRFLTAGAETSTQKSSTPCGSPKSVTHSCPPLFSVSCPWSVTSYDKGRLESSGALNVTHFDELARSSGPGSVRATHPVRPSRRFWPGRHVAERLFRCGAVRSNQRGQEALQNSTPALYGSPNLSRAPVVPRSPHPRPLPQC